MRNFTWEWSDPPENIALLPDQVHVWRAVLDQTPAQLARLRESLSEDELERAGRFHFKRDRDHFIAARGGLRDILSRYLLVGTHRLSFRYSQYGKPELVDDLNHLDLRFNLTHSRGIALYALTMGREVGIDIEFIRADLADEEIARRFFSTQEVQALLSLPEEIRNQAFFTCWTRKEAYIKAIGEGLSMPLDRFDVSLIPSEPAHLLETRPDQSEAQQWTLFGLDPEEGYAASLAVRAQKLQLIKLNWSF